MSITTAQIRGARGLLNWSQQDLSERTGISGTSIGSIENGITNPRESTLQAFRKAFENAGIEFVGLDGLRKKSGDVKIFKGRNEFWQFYEDVFQTLQDEAGEVLVYNADEKLFARWLTEDNINTHIKRIDILKEKGVRYKILIKEGDTYFLHVTDYAEYRWIPKSQFSTVPFYVYGKKLAMLIFDEEPTVIILEYPAIAEAYKRQFFSFWDSAEMAKSES